MNWPCEVQEVLAELSREYEKEYDVPEEDLEVLKESIAYSVLDLLVSAKAGVGNDNFDTIFNLNKMIENDLKDKKLIKEE